MRITCTTCGNFYEAPSRNGQHEVSPRTIAVLPLGTGEVAVTSMCPPCASSLVYTPVGG